MLDRRLWRKNRGTKKVFLLLRDEGTDQLQRNAECSKSFFFTSMWQESYKWEISWTMGFYLLAKGEIWALRPMFGWSPLESREMGNGGTSLSALLYHLHGGELWRCSLEWCIPTWTRKAKFILLQLESFRELKEEKMDRNSCTEQEECF